MLCQIQLFCVIILKSHLCWLKCLVIVAVCFIMEVWQLAIRHVTWRINCANYKKHANSGASQGCRLGGGSLLSMAHCHFFFFLPDLISLQARSCPQGSVTSWQDLWHKRELDSACVGFLYRKKRLIIEIDSRLAFSCSHSLANNDFFHPLISQPWSRLFCRKEVRVHFWNCSSCLPVSHPQMPGI